MTTGKRQVTSYETKKLDTYIERMKKELNAPLKWKAIAILFAITILSGVHIYYYDDSNWSLPSKFLVCACPVIIWIVFEMKYKGRRKKNKVLYELKNIKRDGMVSIINVETNRVIEFKEKDDEGTLFLIEEVSGKCFYLWDDQYLIPQNCGFPCNTFEIYTDKNFISALDRKLTCTGQKIDSLKIPGKVKWEYFEPGFPGDLSSEPKSFNEIVFAINALNQIQQ